MATGTKTTTRGPNLIRVWQVILSTCLNSACHISVTGCIWKHITCRLSPLWTVQRSDTPFATRFFCKASTASGFHSQAWTWLALACARYGRVKYPMPWRRHSSSAFMPLLLINVKTWQHSYPTCIQIHHSLPSAVKSSHSQLLCYVSSWKHAFGNIKLIPGTKRWWQCMFRPSISLSVTTYYRLQGCWGLEPKPSWFWPSSKIHSGQVANKWLSHSQVYLLLCPRPSHEATQRQINFSNWLRRT